MNPLVIAYFFGGISIVLCMARFLAVFRWNVNVAMLNPQLIKLCQAGNLDRAIKLCGAAPNTLYVRLVLTSLEAARDMEETDGLRRAAAMETAYAEAYPRAMALDRHGPLLSAAAALTCLAAAAALYLSRYSGALPILAGLSMPLLISLYTLKASLKIRREARGHFEALVKAVRAPS